MIHSAFIFLAQAAPAGGSEAAPGSGLSMLVPFICIGVIFYFLIIRPQSKKQKDHELLIKSVETGDKVVTTGGIHGLISNIKDTTLILKIADNVKIEIDKNAIAVVHKSAPAKA